jgi:hypothetical protein
MQKDFISATPDSGGAGSTTVNVTTNRNISSERSTTINVTGGGITKTVKINQAKGISVAVIVGQNGNIFKIQLE